MTPEVTAKQVCSPGLLWESRIIYFGVCVRDALQFNLRKWKVFSNVFTTWGSLRTLLITTTRPKPIFTQLMDGRLDAGLQYNLYCVKPYKCKAVSFKDLVLIKKLTWNSLLEPGNVIWTSVQYKDQQLNMFLHHDWNIKKTPWILFIPASNPASYEYLCFPQCLG